LKPIEPRFPLFYAKALFQGKKHSKSFLKRGITPFFVEKPQTVRFLIEGRERFLPSTYRIAKKNFPPENAPPQQYVIFPSAVKRTLAPPLFSFFRCPKEGGVLPG